jgi:HEAT repeat protein
LIDQEEIHRQCLSNDPKERTKALNKLRENFSSLTNRQQAWNDLSRLTTDEDILVRRAAAYSLGSAFSQVPDKQKAWNDLISDLIELINNEYRSEKYTATFALCSAFYDVPDKQQAWNDLIKLISGEDDWVRNEVASSLGSAFFQVPDKQKAWNDLIKLTTIEDFGVRAQTAYSLGSVFSCVPDKQKAWNDLHKLTTIEDDWVRSGAANALCSAFYDVPDKQKACNDLHRLTNDKDSKVRHNAAFALGSSFSQVPDKQKAWNDLHKLATDEDNYVRIYANHSLGKVSIFKASQAEREEDYKRELETAISFFEIAAQESRWDNPSQFCLPFYRSFHTILFKKQQAKEEVDKYLEEAKSAIEESKSKELLFEAVKNLAQALKEVQNLENLDFEAMKDKLNHYRKYCDRATELMIETEETAPFATIAMRKGLPYLDRKLKSLIEEIKEKAKIACQEAKGTPAEYAACAVNDFAKKLRIGSPEYLVVQIENLVFLLKSYIPKIEENSLILDRIDKILREEDVVIQYTLLNNLLPQIIDIRVAEKTTPILSEIKSLHVLVDRLIESVDELQNQQEYLDTIQRNLEEIKNDIPGMKENINEVLYELYSPLSTTQKLKVAIPIIPLLASYELETDLPRFVADRIDELKSLVLRFKKNK